MNDKSDTPESTEQQQINEALVGDKSLDTVRDILFGAQVRETKVRHEELQNQIRTSINEVQKNQDKQVNQIEKSIQTLKDQLDKQAQKNAEDINARFADTHERIQQLQKATQNSQSDLQDQLNADREDLEKRALQWNEDLAKQLELVHQQLQHAKTDRSTLGQLLHNMADAITDDAGDA